MNSRRSVIKILEMIEKGAYSNLILARELKKVSDKRDRNLITELVYGVLRYQKRLDYLISYLVKRPLAKIDNILLISLRVGLYQLEFLDRIPARAAVNETVNALKGITHQGGIGFINGILRNYLRNKDRLSYPDPVRNSLAYLSVFFSHPEWMVKCWLKRYGYDKTLNLLKHNNQPAELIIRHNSLRCSEEDFKKAFNDKKIKLSQLPIRGLFRVSNIDTVKKLPLFQEGGFFVQGAAAALASLVLDPKPEMRILDMAAAPGGKTTHLAQLMKNKGEITALDIYDHKVKLIEENCQRLGVKIVEVVKADGRSFQVENAYDMVLLDVPCSGLGLIRHKPEIKWKVHFEDLLKLQKKQFMILENSLKLIKPGGNLLYSTCTLTEQENQDIINHFCNKYQDKLELLDINYDLKRLGLSSYIQADDRGFLELFPPESDTEGFFMAKFKVKGRKI